MNHMRKKMLAWLCIAALMFTCIGGSMAFAAGEEINLAFNKNAIATYEQHDTYDCWADNATDGNTTTPWATSGAPDINKGNPQAIMIDLGAQATMTALNVYWFGTPTRQFTCNIYATDEPTIVVEDALRGTTGTLNKTGLTPDDTYTSVKSSGSGVDRNGTALDEHTFAEPLVGRYITIEVTACVGGNNANLWDLQVMGTFNGNVDANEVVAAEKPDAIEASTGTALSDLPLPQTVKMALLDGTKEDVPVTWSCENYQANKAGDYVFVGTPDLTGTAYKNTNGITSKVVVALEDAYITPVDAAATYTQDNNDYHAKPEFVFDLDTSTRWSSSRGGGDKLPESIMIDLGDRYTLSKLSGHWFGSSGRTYTFNVYVTDEPTIVSEDDGMSGVFNKEGLGLAAADVKMNAGSWQNYMFTTSPTGRYVTIEVVGRSDGSVASINEIELYGVRATGAAKPTKPVVNLALNKEVAATGEVSETQNGFNDQGNKKYAVDGDSSSRWTSGNDGSLPEAIQVDLGQTADLNNVGIYWFGADRTFTFDVYVTDAPIVTDGQEFAKPTDVTAVLTNQTSVGSGSGNEGTSGTVRNSNIFPADTKGRYVTVVVNSIAGDRKNAILWELEVMGSYAEEETETNPLGLMINGTEGAVDENKTTVTWNAEILWDEATSIEEINEAATFVEYGAIYGVSKEAVETATVDQVVDGQSAKKFFGTQEADESIEVYTVFGFRLTSVAASATERAVKFYITYEYNDVTYTVYSDVETALIR